MHSFGGKRIVVGVTGGIAAYKTCYLVRELQRLGAEVRVAMTPAAAKFVTPVTFSALTGFPVAIDLWSENQSGDASLKTKHISLARWADLYVVAPASANTLAKIAHGIADNLLTALILAAPCPVAVAPAMDTDMYMNKATQENIAHLKARGYIVIPPASGPLASGLAGPGRLPEVEEIVSFLERQLAGLHQDLKKVRMVISAGPTHEPIDAVRFIGNRSSGKMGYALAVAAARRGAKVKLVSGPVALETPRNVHRIDVETAEEMRQAIMGAAKKADVVIMSAAVADFTVASPTKGKIKKGETDAIPPLELSPTRDILAELGAKKKRKQVLVGFSLETHNAEEYARKKLKAKNLDLIVMNDLSVKGAGFSVDTNVVTLFTSKGRTHKLKKMPKLEVAEAILNEVTSLLRDKDL